MLPFPAVELVLEPFVEDLLKANADDDLVRGVFAFLEEMAREQDVEVVNLLHVGIVELWAGEPETLARAWKHMGIGRIGRQSASGFPAVKHGKLAGREGGWRKHLTKESPESRWSSSAGLGRRRPWRAGRNGVTRQLPALGAVRHRAAEDDVLDFDGIERDGAEKVRCESALPRREDCATMLPVGETKHI